MTDKEKNLIWLLANFPIYRYLMDNTKGREDGYNKAMNHLKLCDIYLAYHYELKDIDDNCEYNEERMHLHDELSELTSYMDEQIGFPLDDTRPDYDTLAPLFFDKYIEICKKAMAKLTEKEN